MRVCDYFLVKVVAFGIKGLDLNCVENRANNNKSLRDAWKTELGL